MLGCNENEKMPLVFYSTWRPILFLHGYEGDLKTSLDCFDMSICY